MVDLALIRAARERLGVHVRRTPLVRAIGARATPAGRLSLKLESLQVTGSFKARGATNKVLSLPPGEMGKGLVTASGGNHGLAVAYAGWLAKVPAKIFLPANVPASKVERLEGWGAEILREGSVWDEADRAARRVAEREGLTYVHPFADPAVVAGQGTIGLEILEDGPENGVV